MTYSRRGTRGHQSLRRRAGRGRHSRRQHGRVHLVSMFLPLVQEPATRTQLNRTQAGLGCGQSSMQADVHTDSFLHSGGWARG